MNKMIISEEIEIYSNQITALFLKSKIHHPRKLTTVVKISLQFFQDQSFIGAFKKYLKSLNVLDSLKYMSSPPVVLLDMEISKPMRDALIQNRPS